MEAAELQFLNWIGKDNKIALFLMMVITVQSFNNHLQLKTVDTNTGFLRIWNSHLYLKRDRMKAETFLAPHYHIFREKVIKVSIQQLNNSKKQELLNKALQQHQ